MTKTIFLLLLLFIIPTACYSDINQNKSPTTIVIFGSTGDLTARKLFPAIYNLANDAQLNEDFSLVGVGRRPLTQENFHASVYDSLQKFSRTKPTHTTWNTFKQHVHYHEADFHLDEAYISLKSLLDQLAHYQDTPRNTIFYLATDSQYFPIIISKLHQHHLVHSSTKVIIEKPFGHDLQSSIDLQDYISQFLTEKQIYRIDHYLGKTGVHKLCQFRFQDSHFEWLFNRNFVKNIQLTLSETIGIGTRANFYENTGHLRDVVQNHAMQIFALALMEKPVSSQAADIHKEKIRLLDAIRPFPVQEMDNYIHRGQYGPGIIDEQSVPGYRQEKGVPESSQVETFVQAKMYIDNDRWKDVPIYIRSGKRLAEQTTQNTLNLKPNFFDLDTITISIQPKSEVYLSQPNDTILYELTVDPSIAQREAYENLILAAVQGDQSDFVSMDEVNSTWRLFTPVLDYWKSNPHNMCPLYESGTWGPECAIRQLLEDGIGEWKIISNNKN